MLAAVPSDPEAILDFWFGDAARDPAALAGREDLWFGGSEATDARIRERFGAEIEEAAAGARDAWLAEPRSSLALVVLLDQFPRNVWRASARVRLRREGARGGAPQRRGGPSRRARA